MGEGRGTKPTKIWIVLSTSEDEMGLHNEEDRGVCLQADLQWWKMMG